MAKHYSRVQAKDYEMVKALLSGGISVGKISKLTGRGSFTIDTIRRSENFEDYHVKMHDYYLKYHVSSKPSKEVKEPTIVTQPTAPREVDNSLLIEELKKNNQLLVKLTASLDDLIKVLKPGASQPTKKWPW